MFHRSLIIMLGALAAGTLLLAGCTCQHRALIEADEAGTNGSQDGEPVRDWALAEGLKEDLGPIQGQSCDVCQKACVCTLAGRDTHGTCGYRDGPAQLARFCGPKGIALDSEGKVYVADYYNYRIRVVHKGQVTTLAGDGKGGWVDGPALKARFGAPNDVAVDSSGNVYVSDGGAHAIKLVSKGQVTTLAGQGPYKKGKQDGPVATALLSAPGSMALGPQGEIYFTDGNTIRMYQAGFVKTLVPSSPGKGCIDAPLDKALLNAPSGLSRGQDGTLYFADYYCSTIRKIVGNEVQTLAGIGLCGYKDGPAMEAAFMQPAGVASAPTGEVYVADMSNSLIRMIHKGQVSTLGVKVPSYGFADGPIDKALFANPVDLVVNSQGHIYVADSYNSRIRVIKP